MKIPETVVAPVVEGDVNVIGVALYPALEGVGVPEDPSELKTVLPDAARVTLLSLASRIT